MSKNNTDEPFPKLAISCLIWLGSGFVSIILMSLLTGVSGTIPYIFYFILPNSVLIIVESIYADSNDSETIIGYILTGLTRLFWGKNIKKLMRTCIFISLINYFLSAFLLGLFWRENAIRIMVTHLIVGLFWGIAVYNLYDKKYFDL